MCGQVRESALSVPTQCDGWAGVLFPLLLKDGQSPGDLTLPTRTAIL
jgi:hypothetical protein